MHGTNSRTKILNDIVALLPQVVPKADLLLSFNPNPAPRSEVACLGVTPAWRYQARLREVAGVGVSINNFTWDFYDSGDNFINRQTNSSPDFATLFNDCGTSSSDIAPSGTVCGNLCVHLGGRDSGLVVMTFHGTDDNGNDIEVSGTEVLEDTTTTSSLSRRDSRPALGEPGGGSGE